MKSMLARIALFAILLFLLLTIAFALRTMLFGAPEIGKDFALDYLITFLISASLYAYMSWKHPGRAYLIAALTGLTVFSISKASVYLLIDDLSLIFEPTTFLVDLFALFLAAGLGTKLGLMFRRRSSVANSSV